MIITGFRGATQITILNQLSMNIVYHGFFLREGLKLLGHNVIEISLCHDDDINTKLEDINCKIDLVVLEVWYPHSIPKNIYKCKHTLVGYFIDSPINEFWIQDLCKVFDHVFVDQQSTVQFLLTEGITSHWLPLCAQESYFRNSAEKKIYDIVFVGNTSANRAKRTNLLNMLQKRFSLTVFQGVSLSQMQTLFSQAKIVLNENFFSGLTLRVFQGLAAGSIVLTEEGGAGVDKYFRDGKHIICYNHENIIETFDNVLTSYSSCSSIAVDGQALCRQSHTSKARVQTLLSAISDHSAFNKKSDEASRSFFEARARYSLAMRFGGRINEEVACFQSIRSSQHPLAAESFIELGDIAARKNQPVPAESYYTSSLHIKDTVHARLKLALLYIQEGKFLQAKHTVALAMQKLPPQYIAKHNSVISLLSQSSKDFELLLVIAHIYFACGKVFSLGFLKQFRDNHPDTAFEAAFLAWKISPNPVIMDFMLKCAKTCNIEGELLPELTEAIKKGILSDRQILYTAEIARKYHADDLAGVIVSSFKKSMFKN